MILDTYFIIDIENNNPDAVEKAEELERKNVRQRIPALVIFELWVSVGKGNTPEKNKRQIQRVLGSRPIEISTRSIAERAGKWEGEIQKEYGSGIGPADSIIASIAVEYNEPVVTNDQRDFNKIPDDRLKVEQY